jgi:pyrimidine deaminase RibD-like protein
MTLVFHAEGEKHRGRQALKRADTRSATQKVDILLCPCSHLAFRTRCLHRCLQRDNFVTCLHVALVSVDESHKKKNDLASWTLLARLRARPVRARAAPEELRSKFNGEK